MKISLIRFNFAVQNTILSVEESLYPQAIAWVEVHSCQWGAGARNRVRRFRTFKEVHVYLNKLSIGGWISDDDYSDARHMTLDIERYYAAIGSSYFSYVDEATDSTPAMIADESRS